MRKIHYIVFIGALLACLLAAWGLHKKSLPKEDNATLMPLFQVGDTFESETEGLRMVLRSIPMRDERGVHPEEFKIVHQMNERYAFLRGLSEWRRQEYFADPNASERRLSEEEKEYLNQLIKTRKITMPDGQP